MSEETPMIETPSDFGHFLLERELGHGGMGGVYLGKDKMLDRPVAIKVMLKSLGDDPTFVERFQREAQAAAKLNHPNIAQIYSFGQENGMPYIAMELCTGGSLDRQMAANPGQLDPVRIMRIGVQLAEGLALAAEQGLVHGDMKPENVLFDADGNAKIVDFGLAAMQGDTNEIWGTPYYISPEKVQRQKIDHRADIYSLGGTLYHALTGVAPFEGEDATAVVRARFDGPPKKPSELRPGLPAGIDDIVMRMLELDPGRRYPTYESLLSDMRRFLESAGPEKSSSAGPRIKFKGAKPRMRLGGASAAASDDGVADLAPMGGEGGIAESGEEEEKKKMSLGLVVGLVVGGIVLLILAIVGGLFWYVHAADAAQKREHQQQIVQKEQEARAAIEKTRKAVTDFGEQFHGIAVRAETDVKNALAQMKGSLPPEYVAAAETILAPVPTQEIADAVAFTNELFTAAAKKAAEAAAAADKKVEAPTNTAEAASVPAGTNAAPAEAATPAATNAAPAKAEAAKPDAAKKDAKGDAAKDAKKDAKGKQEVKAAKEKEEKEEKEEEKAEEKPAEPEKPALEMPPALAQVVELWADGCFCRASDIRVQARLALVLKKSEEVAKLTAENMETVKALADLAQKLVEEFEDVKGMKCVEQTLRKAGVIKSRAGTLVKTVQEQVQRAVARAARAAKAKAEAEAKAAAEAKAEAEYKAKAEAEVKAAQEKFEAYSTTLIPRLAWDVAISQMKALGTDFTTSEGREELRFQTKKIELMRGLQNHFIKHARNYKYTVGNKTTTFTKSDPKGLEYVVSIKDKRGKETKDKPVRLTWNQFYMKHRGLMNRLIIGLVEKGRETVHIGALEWSNHMLGAALTMTTLYSDDPNIPKRTADIVKAAAEKFEPCRKYAAKYFPDIDIGAASSDD